MKTAITNIIIIIIIVVVVVVVVNNIIIIVIIITIITNIIIIIFIIGVYTCTISISPPVANTSPLWSPYSINLLIVPHTNGSVLWERICIGTTNRC